jgi:hypothetical protein
VEKLHTLSRNLERGGEAREGDKNGARRTSKIEIFLQASRTSKGERQTDRQRATLPAVTKTKER